MGTRQWVRVLAGARRGSYGIGGGDPGGARAARGRLRGGTAGGASRVLGFRVGGGTAMSLYATVATRASSSSSSPSPPIVSIETWSTLPCLRESQRQRARPCSRQGGSRDRVGDRVVSRWCEFSASRPRPAHPPGEPPRGSAPQKRCMYCPVAVSTTLPAVATRERQSRAVTACRSLLRR